VTRVLENIIQQILNRKHANSGKAEIGIVDIAKGTFAAKAFVPGFVRGLVITEDALIVTTS